LRQDTGVPVGAPATFRIERRLTPAQAQRRARVQEAARQLALEGGYEAVTMQAVAERSGVARATVYRYFASKDHLLAELTSAWGQEIIALLRRRPPQGSAAERVASALSRTIEQADRSPGLARAVLASALSRDPEAIRAQALLGRLIPDYLDVALGDEAVPRRNDLDTLMAHVFFSALLLLTSGRISRDEALRSLLLAAQTFFAAWAPAPSQGDR